MSGQQQLSNSYKRRPKEQHPLQQDQTSQPQLKRQRLSYHSPGSSPRPEFWDNLSKIWLTKSALKELDRRNTQSVPNPPSPYQQVHQPVTQHFFANLKPIESVDDFLRNCSLRTSKDIKLFSRHGGPDLSGLRGYPEPVHPVDSTTNPRSSVSHCNMDSASRSRSRRTVTKNTATEKTKNSRPKDDNYQQKLIDAGVLPHWYVYPNGRRPPLPLNLEETKRRLAQRQPSLPPSAFSEEEHEEFRQADEIVSNEDEVKDSILPIVLKTVGAFTGARRNVIFSNIDRITDNITRAKPDYYYGTQPEELNRNICIQLTVPNFFLEAKGPKGSLVEAQRQALHDGAIGARAMQSLQSYGHDELIFDNKIYTISSVYHGGTLSMYGHSAAQPDGPGTRPEYHMHKLRSFSMTDSVDVFRQGATAYRNAMDLTREYRNAAIRDAKEMPPQTVEDEDEDESEDE